jgi:hypothetical protein
VWLQSERASIDSVHAKSPISDTGPRYPVRHGLRIVHGSTGAWACAAILQGINADAISSRAWGARHTTPASLLSPAQRDGQCRPRLHSDQMSQDARPGVFLSPSVSWRRVTTRHRAFVRQYAQRDGSLQRGPVLGGKTNL